MELAQIQYAHMLEKIERSNINPRTVDQNGDLKLVPLRALRALRLKHRSSHATVVVLEFDDKLENYF